MLDFHYHPENWGICPVLFTVGNIQVNSYSFFVLLGLLSGLIVYFFTAGKAKKINDNSFFILMAGLLGGILGAKIPIWIQNFRQIISSFPDLTPLLSGRTITGGLLGGTLTVILIKRKLKIKEKRGNLFAPAIAVGVAFGRVGCLLRGCCYGIKTSLPFGVDFGDGILRHPTQIYEIIFFLIMLLVIIKLKKEAEPGYLFYLLMNSYFIFRFFEEFLREYPRIGYFTLFQYISVVVLIFINSRRLWEKKSRE